MFNKPKYIVLFIVILGLSILSVNYLLYDNFINAGRLSQERGVDLLPPPPPPKPKVRKPIVKKILTPQNPKQQKTWFPSEWGADDRRGAANRLTPQKIVMVCSDNWGIEVVPNPDESLAFPVHQLFIVKHGIYNLENIITEELASAKIYEFAFCFAPLRLKGASGSPGNPIAIH